MIISRMNNDSYSKRQTYIVLGLILVVGALLRIYFGPGLSYADDFAYVKCAFRLNEVGLGTYLSSMSNYYDGRTAVVFPLALVIKIFGANERAILCVPLLFSLGAILCAFFLGKILYNQRAGSFAALIIAFIPQEISKLGTAVLPDTFIPLYSGLSLLCLVMGMKYKHKGILELLLYIFSGFFLFCAFEARITCGIIILPLIAISIFSKQRNYKAILIPASSFFALIVFAWIVYLLFEADFLFKYKMAGKYAAFTTHRRTSGLWQYTQVMMPIFSPISKSFISSIFGILGYLVWPAFLYSIFRIRKHEYYRVPFFSFAVLFVLFEFGSTSLTNYEPIFKVARFLSVLNIPAALLVAFSIEDIIQWKKYSKLYSCLTKGIIFLIITCYLLATGFYLCIKKRVNYRSDLEAYRYVFSVLGKLKHSQYIYVTHWRWSLRGKVYMRLFAPATSTFDFSELSGTPIDSIHQAIVVLDTSFFTPFGEYRISWEDFDPALKDIPLKVPEGWKLLFTAEYPPHRNRSKVYVLYAP